MDFREQLFGHCSFPIEIRLTHRGGQFVHYARKSSTRRGAGVEQGVRTGCSIRDETRRAGGVASLRGGRSSWPAAAAGLGPPVAESWAPHQVQVVEVRPVQGAGREFLLRE